MGTGTADAGGDVAEPLAEAGCDMKEPWHKRGGAEETTDGATELRSSRGGSAEADGDAAETSPA